MIATSHGMNVMVIGTGHGSSSINRLKHLLMKLEREVSIEAIIQELDEIVLRNHYDIPLRYIRSVRQAYLEKIRECWFVVLDMFKKQIVPRFTKYTRKIPSGIDRRINKRKTFLKSLI